MSEATLLHGMALTLIDGIGDRTAKKLIAYCGSSEAVFKERKSNLERIPGIGAGTANAVIRQKVLSRAEKELNFIQKKGITPHLYSAPTYPYRLKQCDDGPVVLFTKGNLDLNKKRVVSIVGTRKASKEGKKRCEALVEELSALSIPVISGLAYGIDICAHRSALKHDLQTAAVLAHGLDRIYPWAHRKQAEAMQENGGLITEFISGSNPDRENFPKRNRIVAGLADAVVVVESKKTGGSLITAEIANSYNREVFAIPGRPEDESSEGCNRLIKTHKAFLMDSARDLIYMMGWQEAEKTPVASPTSPNLFSGLNDEENNLIKLLREHGQLPIDAISSLSQMPIPQLATCLLSLEFSGIVRSIPGKRYELN